MQYSQDGALMSVIDLSGNDATVITGPCLLLGIFVNIVMSAHAVTVGDDTTTKITLPASTAAGTNMNCYGAVFSSNITVTPNASSTGTITVFYRPI
jgi:hypothetical protein